MAARKAKDQINLLPKDKFSSSTVGRVLTWLLSTFRIIVIVVEMVVVIAFLSRFWLDAKNTDLNDEIKKKSSQILASQDFEEEFTQTQKKLEIYSELTEEDETLSSRLETVTVYLPPDVFLSSYSFSSESLRIDGYSPSEKSISQFIVNLESAGGLGRVLLLKVDTGEKAQNLVGFSLEIQSKIESENE